MTRIGVMGAGSVGCYVGGKLAAHGVDVVFVGRARIQTELREHGLSVKDFTRPAATVSPEAVRFETDAVALRDCDVVLCCVKSAQTPEVATLLAPVLGPDTVVVSLQNGLGNAPALREGLPDRRVLSAVVGFNVVSRGEGLFHRAMSGPILLEADDHPAARELQRALVAAGVPCASRRDLAPDQWTKLLVNLNNAVSALSGAPTRELLLSPGYRHIVASVIAESLAIMRTAGIRPALLRGVPVGIMPTVLRLPTPLVRLVTRAQLKVDPEARSSMWEDLTRGRLTEVDHLNGEIVRLARRVGTTAAINERIVTLVHDAERAASGSPGLDAATLQAALGV